MFDSFLQGQQVLVLGGTSGLGLATAAGALRAGAQVHVGGRDPQRLAEALAQLGPKASGACVDLADEGSVQAFFTPFARVDHLVVCAANNQPARLIDGDLAALHTSLDSRFWGAVHALRAHPLVADAEPAVGYRVDPPPTTTTSRRASGSGDADLPGSDPHDWSTRAVRADAARRDTGASGRGVRIGHPDTGYTDHPLILGPRLRTADGHDFVDDDPDAHDPMTGGFPGHGTATIVNFSSGQGLQPFGDPLRRLCGCRCQRFDPDGGVDDQQQRLDVAVGGLERLLQ